MILAKAFVIQSFWNMIYRLYLSFLFCYTGADIEPYLPTLMETMLSALSNTENLKIKELAVSAIGAIGKKLLKTCPETCNHAIFFWLTI